MKNDKKAMIQTVVLSVLLPFMYVFSASYFMNSTYYETRPLLTIALGLTAFAGVALYYFVVMRERKSDEQSDSRKRRIKCSVLIQAGVSFCVLFLPLFIRVFFVPLEKGHWDGIVTVYMFFALIEPLVVHLAGMVFAIPKFVATTLEDWGFGKK